ncbi:hypothetical protein A1D23_01190 [Chelonobacter oris]|nr:hypothetical protein [Chelonobacter oris]
MTEWHRIVLFRRSAEVAGQYLRKGSQVYIEGKLKTRKWQDQNGQDRYTTEIHADSLTMLGGRSDNENGGQGSPDSYSQAASPVPKAAAKPAPQAESVVNDFDDDIPFAPVHHGVAKHTIYVV